MERSDLKNCRRVVVKVGTSSITHKNGKFDIQKMDRLCRELADLHNRGLDVILVSSGAVAAGMGRLGFTEKPTSLPLYAATVMKARRFALLFPKRFMRFRVLNMNIRI